MLQTLTVYNIFINNSSLLVIRMPVFGFMVLTDNGNKTEWSPIQSLIIQDLLRSHPDSSIKSMITDNWTTQCPVTK